MGGSSSSSSSTSSSTTTQNTDSRVAVESGGYGVGANATVQVDMFDPAVMAEIGKISGATSAALAEGFQALPGLGEQVVGLALSVIKDNNKVLSERTTDTTKELVKSNTTMIGLMLGGVMFLAFLMRKG